MQENEVFIEIYKEFLHRKGKLYIDGDLKIIKYCDGTCSTFCLGGWPGDSIILEYGIFSSTRLSYLNLRIK
ncbi:MAG: hypothetical protein WC523_04815 [Patescibacteria group bacterium]